MEYIIYSGIGHSIPWYWSSKGMITSTLLIFLYQGGGAMIVNVLSNCKVVDVRYDDNNLSTDISLTIEVDEKIVTVDLSLTKTKTISWSVQDN